MKFNTILVVDGDGGGIISSDSHPSPIDGILYPTECEAESEYT